MGQWVNTASLPGSFKGFHQLSPPSIHVYFGKKKHFEPGFITLSDFVRMQIRAFFYEIWPNLHVNIKI